MPLHGHTSGHVVESGHKGFHILAYDDSAEDYFSGNSGTTPLGRGYLHNHATNSVTILHGGKYSSNVAPSIRCYDPIKGDGQFTATATMTEIASSGEYYISAIAITNANETGYFAPELIFPEASNEIWKPKAYINSVGLPAPLCFYSRIYCNTGTAWVSKLQMVDEDGDYISTVIDIAANTTAKLGAAGGSSTAGVPLELESGNSISGLFRGDEIELTDNGDAISDWPALSSEIDFQVTLYIAKKGHNGGRWAKNSAPATFA